MKYYAKFDAYLSKDGLAFKVKEGKLVQMKDYVTPTGYHKIMHKRRITNLSRAIYECFNEEIPAGYEIDHIDGNKDNNSIDNLRMVTHKENMNNSTTYEKMQRINREILARPEIREKLQQAGIGREPWNKGKTVVSHYTKKPGPSGSKWKLINGKRVYYKEESCS